MTDNKVSIEQMNEEIAGFMGLEIDSRDGKILIVTRYADKIISYHGCFYHSSWSELMPCYIKIRRWYYATYNGDREQNEMKRLFANIQNQLLNGGIELVHGEIYQFIIWLNKQNDNGK